MIRDIIWDFDGTLFDTYPQTVNCFKKALKDNGIDETYENILNYVKISEGTAVTHFKELYDLGNAFIERYKFYKTNIEPDAVNPFPFAAEICRNFVALGGRNYIITHRGDSTLKLLQHHGMLSYFTEVITKKHGFKRKPDPEGFLYLINKHEISKSTALVVGDRACEMFGGKAAGIRVCLYNTNNVELTITPDFQIDSLKQLIDII